LAYALQDANLMPSKFFNPSGHESFFESKQTKGITMKIHGRSLRLSNNAGMSFPICYRNAKLLDLDKCHLPMAIDEKEITCKHCLRILKKNRWA
jgi:hypothetical protein